MKRHTYPSIIYLFILILFSCQKELIPIDERWQFISGKRELAVSGISPTTDKDKYLVVHDNKKKGQLRVGLIDINADSLYIGLEWPTKTLPMDLEALSDIPGLENEYIAMGSWGFCYWIKLDLQSQTIDLIKEFRIPGSGPPLNLENLLILGEGDNLYVAWAHRGSDHEESILYWGSISLFDEDIAISVIDSVFINIPWPLTAKRHMSDMDIDNNNILWTSATSDPGDDGPYKSAIYKIGLFEIVKEKINFNISQPFTKQFVFEKNKVEALAVINNKIVFATDDENLGSAINISIDAH
ncbi:MAG: hypothetical protein VX680_01415 [Candidatus Neomarinimicrobiota bacterium]|nr:hypothetical protein [Candidatus Neomarinimicrobiota bacterium]